MLNPLSGYLRLANRLTELWPEQLRWEIDSGAHPHEAHVLALDSTKAREQLHWAPTWGLEEAIARIVAWYLALRDGEDMRAVKLAEIAAFEASARGQPDSGGRGGFV